MQQQSTEPITTDPQHDWHFTFGGGHRFDGRFVTIHGTDNDARAEMFRHFGNGWCAQYDATRPTEVTKFPAGLTELPRAEWPDPARPTILNFGVFGIPDAHLDTPATATDIFERIRDELASAGYDLDVLTLMFGKGGQVVDVADSDDFIIGTVSIGQPEPTQPPADEQPSQAEPASRAHALGLVLSGTTVGLPIPEQVQLYHFGALQLLFDDGDMAAVDAWCTHLGLGKAELDMACIRRGGDGPWTTYGPPATYVPLLPGWTVRIYCVVRDPEAVTR